VSDGVIDLILVVLIIMSAVIGARQGFFIGALSFAGFFGGALVGLQLAPLVAEQISDPWVRIVVSLIAVFGFALVGHTIAAWAGLRIRYAIRNDQARRLDDAGGVVVSVVALLLVAWMVAGPLASSPLPLIASSVRNSKIINAVDGVMPDQARVFYNGLRDTIASRDFPDVFGGMVPTRAREVPEPDQALVNSPAVRTARLSVVKVTGTAPSCRRSIEGSGFVFAPGKVMTNAHVVAGTTGDLTIEIDNGPRASGRVVYYDYELDIAVIHAPKLNAPVMQWAAGPAERGDDAIVVGYPLNGPFNATSARVRDKGPINGPNIYEAERVTREVYTLRSDVRSGNSGGPLLDPDGKLLGVIFAAAVDDPETGFALTADEVQPVAEATAQSTVAVGTGPCT